MAKMDMDSAFRLGTRDEFLAAMQLYCDYIEETRDFFIVSQHPSAPPALRNLVQKYKCRLECGIMAYTLSSSSSKGESQGGALHS